VDELALCSETAEAAIALVEEALDLARHVRSHSFDLDGAAHGEKRAHEVPVEVEGWLCAGVIPPGSNAPESSAGSEVEAGVDWLDAAEAAPHPASIAAKNAIRAATSTTVFAVSARALAAAMREPFAVRRAGEESRSGGSAKVVMATMEANEGERELNCG
jgi:hypothetical protein